MRIVVMPGDGIGPEIVASTVRVLRLADPGRSRPGMPHWGRTPMDVTTNMFGDILSDEAAELLVLSAGMMLGWLAAITDALCAEISATAAGA